MTATAYASAADFNQFWSMAHDVTDATWLAEATRILQLASTPIHAALYAVGCHDTVSAAWALDQLSQLNIVAAGCMYNSAAGPVLNTEERKMYLEWVNSQLEQIRTGQVDLTGQPGASYPACGTAQYSATSWNAAQIVLNRIMRTGA